MHSDLFTSKLILNFFLLPCQYSGSFAENRIKNSDNNGVPYLTTHDGTMQTVVIALNTQGPASSQSNVQLWKVRSIHPTPVQCIQFMFWINKDIFSLKFSFPRILRISTKVHDVWAIVYYIIPSKEDFWRLIA